MSLREQIHDVARAKEAIPYKLAGYRLVGEITVSNYRVVLRYEHVRNEPRFVTHNFSNQREALERVITADKLLEVEP